MGLFAQLISCLIAGFVIGFLYGFEKGIKAKRGTPRMKNPPPAPEKNKTK